MKKLNSKRIFDVFDWQIGESSFRPENNLISETTFALGNGYLGIRGNFEEGIPPEVAKSLDGTYVNGFFDSAPIIYGEEFPGYAKSRQTMLNVTDLKRIEILVDGESFNLGCKFSEYQRTLDFREGVLKRKVLWKTKDGKLLQILWERLVSFERKHVVGFRCSITLNSQSPCSVILRSYINGEVFNTVTAGDPRVGSSLVGQVLSTESKVEGNSVSGLIQRTKTTEFLLGAGVSSNATCADCAIASEPISGSQIVGEQFHLTLKPGSTVHLEKLVAIATSRDFSEAEVWPCITSELQKAATVGFNGLVDEQKKFLAKFWHRSVFSIEGDDALQQAVRFNLYHLLQSVGRDGRTNIGAKGITGEGYEGHYFWDTEIFVSPVFLYSQPEIAKRLLEFRVRMLPKALQRAKEMSQRGALFPWRTIAGEETSPYYPAGSAQYHINADIAFALKKYTNATQDFDFLAKEGAGEMLFQTARLWADLGRHIPGKGFCINGVTGPDEYKVLVNNNLYTNLMAREHLSFAVDTYRLLEKKYPNEWKEISQRIGLNEAEVSRWQKAANEMYTKYDSAKGIYAQDDSFLELAPWDFEGTPTESYPLLLHFHPLVYYRHQVLKQADIVLATLLQPTFFSRADKKRIYDYYEPRTTHDSSLSTSTHAIVACEIGYFDKAQSFFGNTARVDLDDLHGNSKDGIHVAAMAGSWLVLTLGYAGMREIDGQLRFAPTCPPSLKSYKFRVTFRKNLLEISVSHSIVQFALIEGSGIEVLCHGKVLKLSAQNPSAEVSIVPRLEAVIFDLDGVITDTAELHFRAWERLCLDEGLTFDRELNHKLKGISRSESLRIILEHNKKSVSEGIFSAWQARKNGYFVDLLKTLTSKDILPGISDLLVSLRKANIKIGLASASRNAPTILERLGLEKMFDVVVDSAKVSVGKPDPEIFLTAADALGVPTRNCVGVEDAVAGVEAIVGGGIKAVGIGLSEKQELCAAHLANTSELNLGTLERLFV